MPLQKPHPPVWIPGVVSPESVTFAARHGYPYVALAPPLDLISDIYDLYEKVAKEEGYTPTPENRGLRCTGGMWRTAMSELMRRVRISSGSWAPPSAWRPVTGSHRRDI